MKPEAPVSNNERAFALAALRQSTRIDGRGLHDYRNLTLSFGCEPGQVMVELGRTRVYVVVSSEIVRPYTERPTEGFFYFNVQFAPMASPHFESNKFKPSPDAVELGRILERSLRESRAVDSEALCIVANEKVWSIRVDIRVLDHNGNIIDCAGLATILALLHFRRCDVTIDGDDVTVHPPRERQPVPLTVHHIPVPVTFAFFENKALVVDPSHEEEQIMVGRMTIVMNTFQEVCCIQKSGWPALPAERVIECANLAMLKVIMMTEKLQEALKNPDAHTFEKTTLTRFTGVERFLDRAVGTPTAPPAPEGDGAATDAAASAG
eukprot:CAMPEP_0177660374 /NCGR_PEP_ID=MMETSP0447-20121125/18004_1 /TAXON_ID=0 /ORGANISM="Stygamoeba regulata, Strain BSH-02190019" /LENGTH=321 /DNA_ID=CAMNT_0019165431 /DNA_START=73 /DNA_END=1034 /DNA_ORIENTATION=-